MGKKLRRLRRHQTGKRMLWQGVHLWERGAWQRAMKNHRRRRRRTKKLRALQREQEAWLPAPVAWTQLSKELQQHRLRRHQTGKRMLWQEVQLWGRGAWQRAMKNHRRRRRRTKKLRALQREQAAWLPALVA